MLERINMGHRRTWKKAHRVHISCKDAVRSESDLLHRFIAQLKLPNFQIEKVNVLETPHSANIVFRRPKYTHIESRGFLSLFKRKSLKSETQLKLNLNLYKLDAGLNFFLDYEFEYQCRQAVHDSGTNLVENVHVMIKTAFDGASSFSISPMPEVDF